MIRRDITLTDGRPAWLLISQTEHARMSGELARFWDEPFSEEVIDSIMHHDDGWAAWESAPQIDLQHGRPYSFLEMPIEEALTIWDGSIAAARRIGPLAAAIVAGHFIALARGSDHACHPPANEWLTSAAEKRAVWLTDWQRLSETNTLAVADRGQQMLLTSDLLSLWLCCDGPVASADGSVIPNAEMKSRSVTVLGNLRFSTQRKSALNTEIDWQGSLAPWPFSVEELTLAASAIAAPVARYHSWPELVAASWPVELRWRLGKTLSPRSEC